VLDFFQISKKLPRKEGDPVEVRPDFTVGRSKDLMVRGKSFYAIWDEEKGLWSTDEYDVQRLVDAELMKYADSLKADGVECSVKLLRTYSTNGWNQFRKFMNNVSDNSHPLDMKLTFANTEVKKSDHVSRRLPYSLALGDYSAWDELVGTLYSPEERAKIEWAIGAIVSGDSKKIEKFLVFYGPGGTGKSTIMKIIQKLFAGYIAMFEAKALVGANNAFATEAFKSNPLVAIQHDGDLSKIDDNSTLNSIVGHDTMRLNEKYKPSYEAVINAFLFMGTNKPVKITDAKSGLIRRLIDVHPTGNKFEPDHYFALMARIDFELGAIAQHCLDVYRKMGKNYYNGYKPVKMMFQTDVFFNFVEEHYDVFRVQDGTTLKQAWELYKEYAEYAELGYKMKYHAFREELKNYFDEFHERLEFGGTNARSVYKGFNSPRFKAAIPESKPPSFSLVMEEPDSIFDEMYAGLTAQYANASGNPKLYWDKSERIDKDGNPFIPEDDQVVSTVLGDLDTSKLHFVKIPENHIVIDFDLTDEDGNKSLEENLKAASAGWPPTYAELSKSGNGVHLHYIYDGDVTELASEYAPGIEIKSYRGNASLRRKLTKCNNVSVATMPVGPLPFREKKPVLEKTKLKSEEGLRHMIQQNLLKQYHSGTKPSVDFIKHLLDEAYEAGYPFDVSDMRQKILLFAMNSKNQSEICVRTVAKMRFASAVSDDETPPEKPVEVKDERIVFFDCEVYPNLFVVCWSYEDSDTVVEMIEPTPQEIETLIFNFKLVGFNNRPYDNHILWARYLGATTPELYKISQKIIVDKDPSAQYGKAWSLSYADVYDFSSVKQSLKKWQIVLGIHHMEMDIPWDQPVPKERINDVVKYCGNDVTSLKEVFKACKQDFVARQALAEMSGLEVNNSTRQHAIRIMFGDERNPQKDFVYTDLSEMFGESKKGADDGYKFDPYNKTEKSTFRGEVVGEGGYVYAEPGMYEDVFLLDIASMHPSSIIQLNLFGKYTDTFRRLVEARLALKHGDYDEFARLLPGVPVPGTEEEAEALSNALKLVINSIYGYTSAKFNNPFRDKRNVDNIVAKRGALFMVLLKKAVQEMGFTVAHIKTDSIKIPGATPDLIEFIHEFGAEYGYTFEHEATYKKMCLVNDAVFIAYVGWNAKGKPEHWKAVGAEFQQPYVFKTLFTDEPITFNDLCVTKQVQKGAMYLRFPEGQLTIGGKKDDALEDDMVTQEQDEKGERDTHVGRSGLFVPINPDQDIFKGGDLVCVRDGKDYAVAGTKGYKWAEAEMISTLEGGAIERMVFENPKDAVEGTGSIADVVDMAYFNMLAEDAAQSIEKFGDFEAFVDKTTFQENAA